MAAETASLCFFLLPSRSLAEKATLRDWLELFFWHSFLPLLFLWVDLYTFFFLPLFGGISFCCPDFCFFAFLFSVPGGEFRVIVFFTQRNTPRFCTLLNPFYPRAEEEEEEEEKNIDLRLAWGVGGNLLPLVHVWTSDAGFWEGGGFLSFFSFAFFFFLHTRKLILLLGWEKRDV